MKKYIYILFASLGLLASCEEDLVIYDGESRPDLWSVRVDYRRTACGL